MRKIQLFVLSVVVVLFTACHGNLWDAIEDLDSRVTKLEELCKEMNTNISALQTIVEVIQENDFITGIVPIEKGGEVIGYTIMFGKHEPITIYNGEDGKDGQNGSGSTPIIGVAKDTDGVYYWTLNGEWLLDDEGNKLPVSGKNGNDGENGEGSDGESGTAGKDGVTPQLKIENGYWYVSYDNGATWTELGKAVGEDGEKGDKGDKGDTGNDGDSMFTSVTYDDNNVYFTLTDGSVLIVPRGKNGGAGENDPSDIIKFVDLNVKSALLQMDIDTNGDGEISYGEAANYTGSLDIKNNTNILSFKELQYFTGVTSISFEGCTNLFEVALPNSLDTILDRAFQNNDKLTNILIPDSCKLIGSGAFSDCDNLSSILISNKCSGLKIGSSAFYKCKKLNSVILSGCDSIMEKAFYQCTLLSNLDLKEGCKYIGDYVFYDCSLTTVNLPNSIEYLGELSFDCNTLTSFVFPEKLAKGSLPYGKRTYTNFVSITWNAESYEGSLMYSVYNNSFNTYYYYYGVAVSGAKISNITIGEKVKKIPSQFCYSSGSITTITLPESVEEIGYSAFRCSSLYTVYSKNPIPPILGDDVFTSKIGIIYVPTASVNVYKAAWSDYANKIVGYDF